MDIVERLNDDAQCFCSIRKEAADEIERLREALRKIESVEIELEREGSYARYLARSALQQKDSE